MPDNDKGGNSMEDRENNKKVEEHNCEEHVRYDGGQKINRDGVRIWVETYYCKVCGRRVDVREEVLD
jgi:hypothetical protein